MQSAFLAGTAATCVSSPKKDLSWAHPNFCFITHEFHVAVEIPELELREEDQARSAELSSGSILASPVSHSMLLRHCSFMRGTSKVKSYSNIRRPGTWLRTGG